MGVEPSYLQEFQFDVSPGDQGDPDEIIVDDVLKQKVKEAVGLEPAEEEKSCSSPVRQYSV